jgi:drug/metabolite transporter (DMT)-like permease
MGNTAQTLYPIADSYQQFILRGETVRSDRQYLQGILITFSGVLILSTDALLIRASGAEGFRAAFWRALFTLISLFVIFVIQRRRRWITDMKAGGRAILFPAFLWGASGVTFAIGVNYSGAAIPLVMLSLAPFFASAHAYLLYRTKPHPLTLVAAGGAIAGIVYMYWSQLGDVGLDDLFVTVWTPLFMGMNLSYMREHPKLDRFAICTLGGVFGTLIALALARGAVAVSISELRPLLVLGGLVIPFAQVSISSGTRFIPAAESALIASLETVLGILYVWLFLKEAPSSHTLIGGVIVFGCIIFNTVVQAYRVKR